MKLIPFVFILQVLIFIPLKAQVDSLSAPRPSIMVIPFAKANEDMRTVLEDQAALRIAVNRTREELDFAGFPTIDFRAKLRQLSAERAMESSNVQDIKQEIIELSGADIYVEVEVLLKPSPRGNTAGVILTAYDVVSGLSLANSSGNSPQFYTQQYDRLADKAVLVAMPDLIAQLQEKAFLNQEQGQLLSLNIGISPSAGFDLDTEVGTEGMLLGEALILWLEDHCQDRSFHVQGTTASKMIIDQLRIPNLNPQTGRPYRTNSFAGRIRAYLRELGIETTRDIQGNKIYITIL